MTPPTRPPAPVGGRPTARERKVFSVADTLVTLPGPSHWRERLAVAGAGAVALVMAGVVRPDRSDCSPSSELQPDDAPDHLTDAEVYRYADRLTDQLPAAEAPRSAQLGLVALAGSGLVLALLWVPWNERTIPGPTSDADGVTTGRIGAELLGTGRTLAVLAAVGLAWLVVAAIGIRRAAPALALAGAVASAAIVHVWFAGVSDANGAGPGSAGRRDGRGRRTGVGGHRAADGGSRPDGGGAAAGRGDRPRS